MDEVWHPIKEFPGYSVSDFGRVRNDDSDRIMRQQANQKGLMHVGLMRDGVQYKRSVARLVALSFCPRPIHLEDTHDTPINLDGDRRNNCAANILWRPSWFAVRYHKQFITYGGRNKLPRIMDAKTGEVFDDIWIPVVRWGLLYGEIISSLVNNTLVWPTYQRFVWFEA